MNSHVESILCRLVDLSDHSSSNILEMFARWLDKEGGDPLSRGFWTEDLLYGVFVRHCREEGIEDSSDEAFDLFQREEIEKVLSYMETYLEDLSLPDPIADWIEETEEEIF